MEHPEPGNDWLTKLSDSLKTEAPTSEWKSCRQISMGTGWSAGAAKWYASQKVQSGEWETKKFHVLIHNRKSWVSHFRPITARRAT